jgi:predicted P-loop ATPase
MRGVSQHLAGKWIIEIGELESFKGATLGIVRSFLTRRYEEYLRRFAHTESVEPRQCIFGGTTNEQVYLHDEAGNRRDWPVKTGVIDIDALRANRDQLWAEAVVRYRNREPHWPDRALEKQLFKPEQDARFDHDSWTEFVLPYLKELIEVAEAEQKDWDDCKKRGVPPAQSDRPRAETSLGEVYRKTLGDPTHPYHPGLPAVGFDRKAQLKVRAILTRAGWHVTRKSHGSWRWEYPG